MDMLCRYHGVDLPEAKKQELRDLAKKKEGVSGAELKAVLESLGFEVFIFKGALDRSPTGLYHHLDRERPVLVMTSRDGKGFHYQVLMGYDEERGNLILYDQKRGTVLSAKPDFAKHWASANCFALLAVPKRAGETGGRTGVGSGEEKR
jgi:ABC-type bacteriocin/lantibiotic exporter with double-glycine peptidase domain